MEESLRNPHEGWGFWKCPDKTAAEGDSGKKGNTTKSCWEPDPGMKKGKMATNREKRRKRFGRQEGSGKTPNAWRREHSGKFEARNSTAGWEEITGNLRHKAERAPIISV